MMESGGLGPQFDQGCLDAYIPALHLKHFNWCFRISYMHIMCFDQMHISSLPSTFSLYHHHHSLISCLLLLLLLKAQSPLRYASVCAGSSIGAWAPLQGANSFRKVDSLSPKISTGKALSWAWDFWPSPSFTLGLFFELILLRFCAYFHNYCEFL